MKRPVLILITWLALAWSAPLVAQAPKGWMVRIDRSMNASDPDASGAIKFVTMGTGFHATTPQAAVFWNPSNAITGNYSLKGSFTLVRPSNHTNYYGLVFGGTDLGGAGQSYIYFMVAQDGTWLVKRREGNASTQDIAGRTPSPAVKVPDATGKSTNELEVRVTATKTDYVVNGTVVHSAPKSGLTAKTDGLYGVRVNHQLEVHIDGLAMTKQ